MKKLTRKSLDELAKTLPVIEKSLQMSYLGGGDGTAANPYTEYEYECMVSSGTWKGGYVEGWGYTHSGIAVTSYDPNNLSPTGVESYDTMYRAGFEIGFNAGLSGSNWDDVLAISWSFVLSLTIGPDASSANYEMYWHTQGIKDGVARGLEAQGN